MFLCLIGRLMTPVDLMRDAASLMKSRGLVVKYASGWESRGRPYSFSPTAGVICHHTASPTDIDNVLINGRSDLPGPLCHYALHANGDVVLIAAGYANHAGESVAGAPSNSDGLGVEATGPKKEGAYGPSAFDNYAEYQVMINCILEVYGWNTSKAFGHKESCQPPGRKIDPSFDMSEFRSTITAGLVPGDDVPAYSQWSVGDRKKLVEDVIKAVTRGELPDGSKPEHIVAASTGEIVHLQELMRIGDSADPAVADTHGGTSIQELRREVDKISEFLRTGAWGN